METNKAKKYLKEINKSINDVAQEIGYTRPHLTNVLNGKVNCGNKLALVFEIYSDKAVTFYEMKNIYRSKQNNSGE